MMTHINKLIFSKIQIRQNEVHIRQRTFYRLFLHTIKPISRKFAAENLFLSILTKKGIKKDEKGIKKDENGYFNN